MRWESMTPEQSAVYREMLRRGLRERRVRRRERRFGPRLRLLASVAALGGLLAGAFACGLLSVDDLLRVREVRVTIEGPGAVSTDQVFERLGIAAGGSLRGFDRQAALARLRELPRVRDARISYGWFHRLDVVIAERRAVAVMIDEEGRAFEVGREGMVMAAGGETLADLPLISLAPGLIDGPVEPGARVCAPGSEALLDLLDRLQADHPALWEGVSQGHLLPSGEYELYWIDGATVVWGRGEVSELRLRAWAGVMEDLGRRGEHDAVVDLRLHGQILVRLPEGTTNTTATG